MEKPIVFLSHSSRDKIPLAALKQILDERAAGSLNFFLSSDGESIKFGRNWVVRVSDALAQSKLMFVFLSPHSADSKWIHFEAGCAYAHDIRVVPVCLPGIDLNRITPPLSLLQGFNLHSYEAMENLARICNDTFQMKIKESFCKKDFDTVVSSISEQEIGFFGEQTQAIDSIVISTKGNTPAEDFNLFPALQEICKQAGMNCHSSAQTIAPTRHNPTVFGAKLELPGCIGGFYIAQPPPKANQPTPSTPSATITVEPTKTFSLSFTLSPELFHVNAPMLDRWFEQINFKTPILIQIIFQKQIKLETVRHRLTTRLYQCGIISVALNEASGFKFDEFNFNLSPYGSGPNLSYMLEGKLENAKLSAIVEKLFASGALWIHQPDLSEMIQGG
jgi:hypothetical protein